MPYLYEGQSASDDVHRDAMRTSYRGDHIVILSRYEPEEEWLWAQIGIRRDVIEVSVADLRQLAQMVTRVADRLEAEAAKEDA